MCCSTSNLVLRLSLVVAVVVLVAGPELTEARSARSRSILRRFFKCPVCYKNRCPRPRGAPGCTLMLEPGVCGCCMVCAGGPGDTCGLNNGRCAEGLQCLPPPGVDMLTALFSGQTRCTIQDAALL